MLRETWRRAGRAAVWSVGLAAGAAVLVLGLIDERAEGMRVAGVLSAVLGWTFMASGLVAARRRPDNRLGPLMIGLGVLWLAAQLSGFSHTSAVLATAGAFLADGYVVRVGGVQELLAVGRPPPCSCDSPESAPSRTLSSVSSDERFRGELEERSAY
jgi:hypothetical protein